MDNQHDICRADMAAFMTELGIALKKEGASLQALAKQWFEGTCEADILRLSGIQVDAYGQQIMAIRDCLCNKCQMTTVVTGITIGKSSEEEKHPAAHKRSGSVEKQA